MDLKRRLGALRRQTGASAGTVAVAERVQRYRPNARSPARSADVHGLARRLGGTAVGDGVILIEHRVSLERSHGRIPLRAVQDDHRALPEAEGVNPHELVFLDTETSGLAGGTGTVVFLLGLARIDGDGVLVRQYQLTRFGAEAEMLGLASEWLRDAGCIVSYNGKCFDVPLLSARCRLAGVPNPFERLPHLDLLHPTRRIFGRRWGDCRLVTAERELLGFAREGDLPGSEAPEAWFAWVRRGDPARLPGIARHNHWDVLSLAALLPTLARACAAPGAWNADVAAIARRLLAQGEEAAAMQLLEDHREKLDRGGLLELARLQRRLGRWRQARAIWEPLAEQGDCEAIERLAKYHEHVAGDPERALAYARRLPQSPAHRARLRRLQAKVAAGRAASPMFDTGS